MNTFGGKIKAERMSRNQSLAEFADPLGISRGFLNNIEKGRQIPKPDLIAKFASVLGIPVVDLQACADRDRLGQERAKAIADAMLAPPARQEWEDAGPDPEPPDDIDADSLRRIQESISRIEWERDAMEAELSPREEKALAELKALEQDLSKRRQSPPPAAIPPDASPQLRKAIEWLNALPPQERDAELRYLEERVRRLEREGE